MIIKVGSKKATSIPNSTLRDKRLALDELGLLVRLLSRPAGWEIYPVALQKETGWGRDKLRKVLSSLESAGYLRRIKGRYQGDDPKKMGTWKWYSEIYDEAQEFPEDEPAAEEETAPCPENPSMVHHALKNRTTVGPAPVPPGDGEQGHIDLKPDLKKEPDLKPPPPPDLKPPSQNQGGGGGYENSEIKNLNGIEEINEYIRLGRLFGGKNGLPPSSPPAWEARVRTRILEQGGGKLSKIDLEQLSLWTLKEQRKKAAAQIQTQTAAGPEPRTASQEAAGLAAIHEIKKRLGGQMSI